MEELLKELDLMLAFAEGYVTADPTNKYYLGRVDTLLNIIELIKIKYILGENKNG